MGDMKKKAYSAEMCPVIIPMTFSVAMTLKSSLVFLAMMIISMFLAVELLPFARRRESMWIFLLVSIIFIPVNVKFIVKILPFLIEMENLLRIIIYAAVIYIMIFTIEEIVFVSLSRVIWRKQYKINI